MTVAYRCVFHGFILVIQYYINSIAINAHLANERESPHIEVNSNIQVPYKKKFFD